MVCCCQGISMKICSTSRNVFEYYIFAYKLWVLREDKNEKWVFASNDDWNENDIDLSKRIFTLYSKRWGIETSYRVKNIHSGQKRQQRHILLDCSTFYFQCCFSICGYCSTSFYA